MKKFKKLLKAPAILLAAFALSGMVVSCSEEMTPEKEPPKSDQVVINDINQITDSSQLVIGSTIYFNNVEYLVTANTYAPGTHQSSRAVATESTPYSMWLALSTSQKYYNQRRKLLEETLNITNYAELYSYKAVKSMSPDGEAELQDVYNILAWDSSSNSYNLITEIKHTWNSSQIYSKIVGLEKIEQQTDQIAKFSSLTETEIRNIDPPMIEIDTTENYYKANIDNKYKATFWYLYENEKINFDKLYKFNKYNFLKDNDGNVYQWSSTGFNNTETGEKKNDFYYLRNLLGNSFLRCEYNYKSSGDYIYVTAAGDGELAGDTNYSTYKNQVAVYLSPSQRSKPYDISAVLGETKTHKTLFKGSNPNSVYDFNCSFTVENQINNGTSTAQSWQTESSESFNSIYELNSDVVKVSANKTTVNEIEVPEYMMIFAPFENSSAPLNGFGIKIIPEWDSNNNRLIFVPDWEKYLSDYKTFFISQIQ